jgi:anti-sigma B factor antagonist
MSSLAHLLDVHEDQGVVLARLAGEVDLANAHDLEETIVAAVPNTALGMVLDLTTVTYLDSAGVLLLLDLVSRFQWRGQELALVAPAESRVRRVLSLAGTEGVVVLDTTTDEARSRMPRRLEPADGEGQG